MPRGADGEKPEPGAEPVQSPDADRIDEEQRFVLKGLYAGKAMPDIGDDGIDLPYDTDMGEPAQHHPGDEKQEGRDSYQYEDLPPGSLPAGIPEQGIDLARGEGMDHIELGDEGQPEYGRSEEQTSELQSRQYLVCRLLLEKKKEQAEIDDLFNLDEVFRPAIGLLAVQRLHGQIKQQLVWNERYDFYRLQFILGPRDEQVIE